MEHLHLGSPDRDVFANFQGWNFGPAIAQHCWRRLFVFFFERQTYLAGILEVLFVKMFLVIMFLYTLGVGIEQTRSDNNQNGHARYNSSLGCFTLR